MEGETEVMSDKLPRVGGREPRVDGADMIWYIYGGCGKYLRKDGKWHNGTGFEQGYWLTREEAIAHVHACARRELVEQGKAKELPGGGLLMIGEGPHNPPHEFTPEQIAEIKKLKSQARLESLVDWLYSDDDDDLSIEEVEADLRAAGIDMERANARMRQLIERSERNKAQCDQSSETLSRG